MLESHFPLKGIVIGSSRMGLAHYTILKSRADVAQLIQGSNPDWEPALSSRYGAHMPETGAYAAHAPH